MTTKAKITTIFSHKYKPYYLNDFYIPTETKRMVKALIDTNEIHLLITGDSNTGKTSFLYAFVRDYYAIDKDAPFPENEVLFINNLKEQQGIPFFRNEMKTFCQSRSQLPKGKKKMIIIDDMDMINQQCQQVMSNYMDRYGHNIHFIYSCMNIQKIVESIQSRIVVISLFPPKQVDLEHLYRRIVHEEQSLLLIHPDQQTVIREFLITNSNGNLRELVNCMEKCIVYSGFQSPSVITLDICRSLFLTRIFQSFQVYLDFLKEGDLPNSIQVIYSILQNGYSVVDILDYFFQFIKMRNRTEITETQKYEIVKSLCKYITIVHNVHEENIELILFTNSLYKILFLGKTKGEDVVTKPYCDPV